MVATEAASTIPFGAVAQLLPATPTVDRHDLLHRAEVTLKERAGDGAGVILSVDDAHLLDPASAALIHHVALRGACRVLVTVRTGEHVPDPVTALWKDGLASRTVVTPLPRTDTEALLRTVLGGAVASRTLERLWDLSQGNPLFLRELVAAAAEDEGDRDEPLTLSPGSESGARLIELVEARFRRLDPAQRAALEAIAVAEPLPLAMATEHHSAATFEALERRGITRLDREDDVDILRFTHPLYSEIVRFGMPTLARRRILGSLARSPGATQVDLLRRARWHLDALEHESDSAELYLDAGQEALARFDPVLAEELARAALSTAPFAAGILRGRALAGLGRAAEAVSVLEDLQPAGPEEIALRATVHAATLFHGLGYTAQALTVLETAEVALDQHSGPRAVCRAMRAELLLFALRFDEALVLAEGVMDDTAAPPGARIEAAASAMMLWGVTGQAERARQFDRTWLDLGDRHRAEAPYAGLRLRVHCIVATAFTGRWREADELAREWADVRVDLPGGPTSGPILAGYGRIRVERGAPTEAATILQSAAERLRESDIYLLRPMAVAFWALASVFAGDFDTAKRALAEADEILQEAPVAAAPATPYIEIARCWFLAASGDRAGAAARAIRLATAIPAPPFVVEALHLAARVNDPVVVAPLIMAAHAQADEPWATVVRDDVLARAAGDHAALEAISHRYAELGAGLLALETAMGAAAVAAESGDRTAVLRLGERVASLRQGTDVAWLPVDEVVPTDGLTNRERELALLVGGGASSREVAEQLHLSVRTVDTHLGHVYQKLGVSGRVALTALLHPPS